MSDQAAIVSPSIALMTPRAGGAVAILQLHGQGTLPVLKRLTGRDDWTSGLLRLVDFGDIDQGLAVTLGDDWAQLMPHGGPRVVQRLLDALVDLGARVETSVDARDAYPEADSPIEADALATLARAASPAAIDLLLAQPALWREAMDEHGRLSPSVAAQALADAPVLDRLVHPPSVVVIGQPNVGKSTLTNRLLGRSISLVADLPGTTRDWVGGLVELNCGVGIASAVAVRWLDTPGLRDSDDPIEQAAIDLARQVIAEADVLIVMRAPAPGPGPGRDWPDLDALPRQPDLWVMNKVDDLIAPRGPRKAGGGDGAGGSTGQPLPISAKEDLGLDRLQALVLERLELNDLRHDRLWAFSPTLRDAAAGGEVDMRAYLSV